MASTDTPAAAAASTAAADEVVLPYFGYGSMMNLVSLSGRNLFPSRSLAAVLVGQRLTFCGAGGMANVEPLDSTHTMSPIEGPECHGVLHWLTAAEIKVLDGIEGSGYDRVPYTARDYEGNEHACSAYRMRKNEPGTPSERYKEILIFGAEQFKVRPEYVDWLRSVPCTPRKTPDQYLKFRPAEGVAIESLPAISRADFPAFANRIRQEHIDAGISDGEDVSVSSVNGKIVKVSKLGETMRTMKDGHAQDATVRMARFLWEPKYGPPPASLEAMTPEHKAYSEDLMASFLQRVGAEAVAELIGTISDA